MASNNTEANSFSDRSHVEHFYEFWFDWKSWREFSYLDAEDKTRGEDRYERREIEKQNRIEREKRRKRDLKRISTLVELSYSKDPRVARFKEEDRRRKEEAKEQKRREKQQRAEAEREEQRRKEEVVQEELRIQAEEKKRIAQVEQQRKKMLAVHRKRLRELVSVANYWTGEMTAGQDKEQKGLAIMEQVERICLSATLEELSAVSSQLADVATFDEALRMLSECARKEEMPTNGTSAKNGNHPNARPDGTWSDLELQLLVKAVNLNPPGTQGRWRQVAEYVSYHGCEERTERDVIKQVKLLKSNPVSIAPLQVPASKADGTSATIAAVNSSAETSKAANNNTTTDEDAWNAEQQRQLEKALKETAASDPERWDKIAAMVGSKSKKQCIRRYKRLAELVKQNRGVGVQ